MIHKRFIPLLSPLAAWLLCEAFVFNVSFFYASLSLSSLIIIFSVRYIMHEKNSAWFLFSISPVLFFLSFAGYAAVTISHFWIQACFLLIIWFLFLYFRNLYYYSNYPEHEEEWSEKLINLMIAGGFLISFSSAALVFVLPAFLGWPLWYMLPALIIISALLFFQFRGLHNHKLKPKTSLVLINILILAEFAWIFSLLPLNFNILALFLAIAYYLGLTIIRLDASSNLNRHAVKIPLLMSLAAIALLLLTSRWL